MNRPGHDDINFFIGYEVEQTPAYGLRTLFVKGVQSVATIEDILKTQNAFVDTKLHINHLYFGANHTFPNIGVDAAAQWKSWENMIVPFLKQGFLCTLDLDVRQAEGLVEGPLCEYNNFIPMISVKLPYVQLLGYNATIKIDDRDFAATNPGVWCHSLHELRRREHFTDWSRYTQDVVIKPKE